MHDDVTLTK